MRNNNLIEVTSQSYIAFVAILYNYTDVLIYRYETIAQDHLFITSTFFPRKSESLD